MPQLLAVRYHNIGTPHARATDLTIPCTDGVDPTHAAVWLRNGGGKSSLIAMLLAGLAPRQRFFLKRAAGGGEHAGVTDYLVPGELGFVACEWLLDGQPGDPPARAITAVAYMLQDGSAQDYKRLFFSARCLPDSPLTQVGDLPTADPAAPTRRLTLTRLRDWLARLREQSPAADVQISDGIAEWEAVLQSLRLDPHLFSLQARMNADEGGVEALFAGVTTDESFTRFIVDTLYFGDEASNLPQFRATIEKNRARLKKLDEELLPEATALDGLVPPLTTLAALVDEHAQATRTMQAALLPMQEWERTLPGVVARLTEAQRTATEAAASERRVATEAAKDATFARQCAAHLRLHAAAREARTRDDTLAGATEDRKRADLAHRTWSVAGLYELARGASQRVAHARALLAAARDGAAPLRQAMDEALGTAHAVCDQAIAAALAAVRAAASAQEAQRRAHQDARDALKDAEGERKQAADDLARARSALTRATAERTALAASGAWPDDAAYEDALETHLTRGASATQELEALVAAAAARRVEEQADLAAQRAVRDQAAKAATVLGAVEAWRTRAGAATAQLRAHPGWGWIEGGAGEPSDWSSDTVAYLARLGSDARLQLKQSERLHGAALDAVEALRRGDPIPMPPAVDALRDALAAQQIAATPVWERLRDERLTPAEVEAALRLWPALSSAVVVSDDCWGPAEHLLRQPTFVPARAAVTPVWVVPAATVAEITRAARGGGTPPRLATGGVAPAPLGRLVWGARVAEAARSGALERLDADLATVARDQEALRGRAEACEALATAIPRWLEEYGPTRANRIAADEASARQQAEAAREAGDALDRRAADRAAAVATDERRRRDLTASADTARAAAESLRRFVSVHETSSLEALAGNVATREQQLAEAQEFLAMSTREVAAQADAMAAADQHRREQEEESTRLRTLRDGLPTDNPMRRPALVPTDLTVADALAAYTAAKLRYDQQATPSDLKKDLDDAMADEVRTKRDFAQACAANSVADDAVGAAVAALSPGRSTAMALSDARKVLHEAEAALERARDEARDARATEKLMGTAVREAGEIAPERVGEIPEDASAARLLAVSFTTRAEEAAQRGSSAEAAALRLEAAVAADGERIAALKALQKEMDTLAERLQEGAGIARPLLVPPTEPLPSVVDPAVVEQAVVAAQQAVQQFLREYRLRQGRQTEALRAFRDVVDTPAVDALPPQAAPRRLKGMVDADIALDAKAQLEQVLVRRQAIAADVEGARAARDNLVTMAVSLSGEALDQLKRFCKHTKLPDALGRLGGKTLLRAALTEHTPEAQALACGERIDRWCRGDAVPTPTEVMAALVQARCSKLAYSILRPDIGRDARPEPLSTLSKFSGGEKLTLTTVLYCALARTRAGLRAGDTQVTATSLLVLDNPLGKANRGSFIDVQTRLASQVGIQFLLWTGLDAFEALSRIPCITRLKNEAWSPRSRQHVITVDAAPLEIVPAGELTVRETVPFGFGLETISARDYDAPLEAPAEDPDAVTESEAVA